jgi:long-chain acyl-CoA synthetase
MNGMIISGDRTLSQSEMNANKEKVAGGLHRMGVKPGDAVSMMLRNDLPFFEVTLGAQVVGAYAVPINWRYTAEEVRYILEDSGAKVLVIHSDLLAGVPGGVPDDVKVLVVPTPAEIAAAFSLSTGKCLVPFGQTDWGQWLSEQAPFDEPPRPAPASMIYTSGTTGHPKGVRREPPTAINLERMAQVSANNLDLRPNVPFKTVMTGPVYHSAPNMYALYAARFGGVVILQPRFDAEGLLRLIEEHQISHLYLVPIMFVRLLALPEDVRTRYDVSSLQFVVHAAAPCPVEVKQKMIEWWGPVINEYYGATETGGVIFHSSEEALRKPGTSGRAIDNGHVAIVDKEGNELGPNETGLIYLGIDDWPRFSYNGRDDDKLEEIRWKNLITAGDIGYLDEDGYLFIQDRVRDMVISGGVNIYPAEIELSLMDMPGVQDCVVFGIPDDEYGESVCAHVELAFGAELDEPAIKSWLREKIASYKVPKTIRFETALPREDSGKIMKRKIRAPYWEAAGRQI